jgi:hypothetical protein
VLSRESGAPDARHHLCDAYRTGRATKACCSLEDHVEIVDPDEIWRLLIATGVA